MRILYIIPSLQHPNVRGPHRHYHFVRELSKRHKITLLAIVRSEISPAVFKEMESYTEKIFTFDVNGGSSSKMATAFKHLPLVGSRVAQKLRFRAGVQEMKHSFLQLVNQEAFDVILFHGKSIFSVIEDCEDLPIVTDFCDATSSRYRHEMQYNGLLRKPLYWWKIWQMQKIEKEMIKKTSHIAFISNRDREAVLGTDSQSQILPLGVDQEYWQRSSKRSHVNRIIFTGVMDYAPNNDAALYLVDNILPIIKEKIPNIEVFIVGRDPSATLLKKVKELPEVTVTGFVEDLRPYLEQATLFVAPVRYASGTQNKVLEAMAIELPIVTTSVVADGLRVERDEEPPVCYADNENDFAEHVIKLLQNKSEKERLADEGRQFIEKHFNWERSAEKLEKMCFEAISEQQMTRNDES